MQAQSELIWKFVISNVKAHGKDIAKLTSEQFLVSRQAVNRHLKILIEDEILEATGKTKERVYSLKIKTNVFRLSAIADPAEDKVWHDLIRAIAR